MKVNYRIEIDPLDNNQYMEDANQFAIQFSSSRIEKTWFFKISDKKELLKAKTFLESQSFDWEIIYEFELSNDEIDDYSAYFPGIYSDYKILKNSIVLERRVRNYDIINDLDSNRIILSEKTQKVLENIVEGLKFIPVESDKSKLFYFLENVIALSSPINVVKASEINLINSSDNLYFIVSDGRYYIHGALEQEIENAGIVMCHSMRYQDVSYDVPPYLIMSRKIVKSLINNNIKGLNNTDRFLPILNKNNPLIIE
ncbi:hypothetical protein [Spirochaeta cellobiosiphila]|uniref:hypothetical protein n=1 Tax=Spirochaeta cellobiosiphila TaxID=504483 RepID=UPI00049120F6|nr:hypothetical protein [Spirochaeta cellobiosiphila]